MLVEMAVADAYAIAWEFTNKQTAEIDFSSFSQHPTYVALKPGQYTDDTQRACANARVLLGHSTDKFNPVAYTDQYVQLFKEDPRDGYSRGFQSLIESCEDGYDMLTRCTREKSSNGAVMGVAPLGYLPDSNDVKLAAMIQAISTHSHTTVVPSQIVALTAHYFLHFVGKRDGLDDWLISQIGINNAELYSVLGYSEDFANDSDLRITMEADQVAAYMLYAILNFDSMTDIIRDVIARGGDTDSAAAVSVAIASCCDEIENDLPKELSEEMDYANPGHGISFLVTLERQLMDMYLKV